MKALKAVGGLIVAAALVLYKFQKAALLLLGKAGTVLKFGTAILVLLHITAASDSSVTATRPMHGSRAQHQVAQSKTPGHHAEQLRAPSATPPAGAPALMPSGPLGAGPINAARGAAAAQNAQLAKETGQPVPTPGAARPTTPAPSQQPQVASAPAMQQGSARPAPLSSRPRMDTSTEVMRETFDYSRDSRRDPFVSLMNTSDLRPTLSDLRLTGILYDLSGRRPVAILRDIAGGQWRVTTGMTLGRMRVAEIRPKTIIFTIEEFGFNRQDSLVLGDTTRVRHR